MKKITDWKGCEDTLTAKKIKPDKNLVKSLLETSKGKMLSSEMLKMSETTAASKFSLAYDSMREALEALAISKGYKIYNHECYVFFLKEIIKESEKGDAFDAIRNARNAVNYYGKKLNTENADRLIKQSSTLRNFVIKIINEAEKNG